MKFKRFSLIFSAFFIFSALSAQVPSVVKNIRIPLWAELDAYPEFASDSSNPKINDFSYPVKGIREVAPFIIEGMVYGWSFKYTPLDKARGVEEILEIKPVQELNPLYEPVKYSSPWIEDNKLNCWCEFTRNDFQIQAYNLWSSIKNPVIQGRGTGDLKLGFEGVREAASNALKDAIRKYYRSLIKNKPKEINGKVLIRKMPVIGVDSGHYTIILDFFLECGTIIEYSVY